jgi:hypothetical protein
MRNVHFCDVSLRVYVPELNRPELDYAIREAMRTYLETLRHSEQKRLGNIMLFSCGIKY